MLCVHGCGNEAGYQHKNGTWCCEPHTLKCPAVKQKLNATRNTKAATIAACKKVACSYCEIEATVGNIKCHEEACYLNPKNKRVCPVCGDVIKVKSNKTCSQKCGATNNSNRSKVDVNVDIDTTYNCYYCGNEVIFDGTPYKLSTIKKPWICKTKECLSKKMSDLIKKTSQEKAKYLKQNVPYEQLSSRMRFEILVEKNGYRCSDPKCTMDTSRFDERGKLPIEIHHIDGNTKNHKLENEILLCCNCHFYTNNYGFKYRSQTKETISNALDTKRKNGNRSKLNKFHQIKLEDIRKKS